jgi:hypothetical protein
MVPKDKKGKYETKIYRDATKFIQKTKLYDTNEVVDDPTESDVISEIAKISKNERDVEKNLMLYSGNRAIRKQLFKEILEKCDFNKAEREGNEKKAKLQAEKKKKFYKKQKNRLIRYLIREVDLNSSKDSIYGYLFFKRDSFGKKSLITEEEFNEIIMRSKAILAKFEKTKPGTSDENNNNEWKIFISNEYYSVIQTKLATKFGYNQSDISKICNKKSDEMTDFVSQF